jgi:hypothetical protein
MRQGGLSREHPFVKALFREALKRFRPLVEEERKRQENSKANIESSSTRQRLKLLEKEAAKFMNRHQEDDEASREPNDSVMGSEFRQKGFSLSPPFSQLILGQSTRFWLNVDQEAFPELSVGDTVEISCATNEISANKSFTPLEPHPGKPAVLRAVWAVKAERVTHATAVSARVGPISAETTIEVLLSEREKYLWVTKLTFGSKRYSVRKEARKNITVLAPLEAGQSTALPFEMTCDHRGFLITGDRQLTPQPRLGVLIGKLRVTASESDCRGTLLARAKDQECSAEIRSLEPLGSTIKIKIENVDHKNQRYLWRSNLLEIASKHPSLSRYLGPPPEFPGQEDKHFRLLLAEIVAEAVCARILGRNAELRPAEYEDNDWDAYYAEYSQLLTEFLPIAHASQVRDP